MANLPSTVLNPKLSGAMAKYLAAKGAAVSELGAGVTSGFAILTYKGKVWKRRHRGEETILMRDDGDGPRNGISVVIVKASAFISKIFYIDGYVDGSVAPPDCFSHDGIRPDPASPKKQCNTCAGCPMNAWGSKANVASGKPGKACSDSKRLAVVPLEDIDNEQFGGPMLLRVPAASLGDMAAFDSKMAAAGFPYFGIGTTISFVPEEAFPKFRFTAQRALTDEEAEKIIEMREGDQVTRLLSTAVEHVTADVADPAAQTLSQRAAATGPVTQPGIQPAQTAAQPVQPPVAAPPPVVEEPLFAETPEPPKTAAAPPVIEDALFVEVAEPVKTAPVQQSAPVAAVQPVAATPVAATVATAPVAAPVAAEENAGGTPADFDAMLDDLLAMPS